MNPKDDNYPKSLSKKSPPSSLSKERKKNPFFSFGSLFVDTNCSDDVTMSFLPIDFKTLSPINLSPSSSGGSPSPVAATSVDDVTIPQPMPCLQGIMVPPFLSKTFDLVDDRSIDRIISWGHKGESFVVWDPVEFSRIILPRNFKHNNFSSFVRQLNTYGFRKIDTDRWEFATEAFQQGKRHLLKTIQRRKSPNSQQVGTHFGVSTETGKSGLKEIENLKTERRLLMQEMVELQQQHRGTAHRMETLNRKLQDAEQRQKQMVLFLAKLIQNPAFVARLQQRKNEHGAIGSSRPKGEFVKHRQRELDAFPSVQSSDYPVQETVGSELGPESLPFHIENVALDQPVACDELAYGMQVGDPVFKGKNVMSPEGVSPEYFISFPENLVENGFPEFNQEEIWSMGFGSTAEIWSDVQYDVSELGATMCALSDIRDMESEQVAGICNINTWPADESPSGEPESHAGQ